MRKEKSLKSLNHWALTGAVVAGQEAAAGPHVRRLRPFWILANGSPKASWHQEVPTAGRPVRRSVTVEKRHGVDIIQHNQRR